MRNKEKAFDILNEVCAEALPHSADQDEDTSRIEALESAIMEKLEKRVAYFSLILNTEEELFRTGSFPTSSDEMYDATVDALIKDTKSIIYYGNFGELFYQLTHLTNYGTMEDVNGELTALSGGLEVDREEYRPVYYSPYGIYYLWMEAYGYLPANMKPAN